MAHEKIAGRYAKSLIDLGNSVGKLDAIYEDIKSFYAVCKYPDFSVMLKSPVISADKKNSIFQAIFGNSWNPITKQFISLLTNKGRESALQAICIAFIEQYKNLHKIRPAKIVTASSMTSDQLEVMKDKFKHWLLSGETMELEQIVDPTLIGGFIMSMGDKYYDSSVKRQLVELKENLYDKSYINLVDKS